MYAKRLMSLICSDHPMVIEMEVYTHLHRFSEHSSEDQHCQEAVLWAFFETLQRRRLVGLAPSEELFGWVNGRRGCVDASDKTSDMTPFQSERIEPWRKR